MSRIEYNTHFLICLFTYIFFLKQFYIYNLVRFFVILIAISCKIYVLHCIRIYIYMYEKGLADNIYSQKPKQHMPHMCACVGSNISDRRDAHTVFLRIRFRKLVRYFWFRGVCERNIDILYIIHIYMRPK